MVLNYIVLLEQLCILSYAFVADAAIKLFNVPLHRREQLNGWLKFEPVVKLEITVKPTDSKLRDTTCWLKHISIIPFVKTYTALV